MAASASPPTASNHHVAMAMASQRRSARAEVYKEADKRSFRQAVDYTENRRTKNSRQARAMAKGTKYGRQAQKRPGKAPK